MRHISAEVVPMGPPPPPKPKQTRDSAFMEKLNAVDEELASSPVCMDSFQVSIGTLNCGEKNLGFFISDSQVWDGADRLNFYIVVTPLFVFDFSLRLCWFF